MHGTGCMELFLVEWIQREEEGFKEEGMHHHRRHHRHPYPFEDIIERGGGNQNREQERTFALAFRLFRLLLENPSSKPLAFSLLLSLSWMTTTSLTRGKGEDGGE